MPCNHVVAPSCSRFYQENKRPTERRVLFYELSESMNNSTMFTERNYLPLPKFTFFKFRGGCLPCRVPRSARDEKVEKDADKLEPRGFRIFMTRKLSLGTGTGFYRTRMQPYRRYRRDFCRGTRSSPTKFGQVCSRATVIPGR